MLRDPFDRQLNSPLTIYAPGWRHSAQAFGAGLLSVVDDTMLGTEVVLGGFSFDPRLFPGQTLLFLLNGTLIESGGIAASFDLRLYDMGAPGTPQAGDLRASVTQSTSGSPRSKYTFLTPSASPTTPGSGPDDGTIYNTERIYEVRAVLTGDTGDSMTVTWAGIKQGIVPLTSWAPSDLTGIHRWWRADVGITLSGSDVTNWLDQQASADLEDGAAPPTMDTINGQDSVVFNDALNSALSEVGSGAAGTYDYIHDGTGATIVIVLDTTETGSGAIMVTCGNNAAHTGMYMFHFGGDFRLRLANGTGTWLVNTGSVAWGTGKHFIIVRLDVSETNDYEVYIDQVSTPDLSGTFIGSPDTVSTHTYNLTVSASSAGVSGTTTMEVAEMIFLTQWISNADMSELETYLIDRYGSF